MFFLFESKLLHNPYNCKVSKYIYIVCKCGVQWSAEAKSEVQEELLIGLEGLLEIVDLAVMTEGVSAGTHSEGWKERIPDCGSCNSETTGTKHSADIWNGQQIGI